MRRLSVAAVVAVSACNWVYGIAETSKLPADVPPPNPVHLTWAAATTRPDGTPDTALAFIPFGSEAGRTNQPIIQVGPPVGMGDLVDAPYQTDGTILIPFMLAGQAWRLVYMLPGESVPTEFQSTLATAQLVVPRTTRPDSPVPPTGSGYQFTPQNHNYPISGALLMTTGDFSSTLLQTGDTDGNQTVTFGYAARAQPLAGPLGSPSIAKHDYVVLAEIGTVTSTHNVATTMTTTQADLMAGSYSMPAQAPTTVTTLHPMINGVDVGQTPNQLRMMSVVSALPGAGAITWRVQYGISPNLALFGFVPGGPPEYIERPLLLPADIWAEPTTYFGNFVGFDAALPYPHVTYAAMVSTRAVGATLKLTSAVQLIWPKGPENDGALHAAMISAAIQPAALATNERLGGTDIGHADATPVSRAQPLVFTFNPEGGASITTDADYTVTLFEIVSDQLVPRRVYRVVAPSVDIDNALLVSGHTYVFSVTTHAGVPNTRAGDFRTTRIDQGYGSATKFSGTFVMMN